MNPNLEDLIVRQRQSFSQWRFTLIFIHYKMKINPAKFDYTSIIIFELIKLTL